MNKKSIWFVWVEGRDNPTVKHDTQAQAHQEAMRLAQLNQDCEVFVCRAVQSIRVPSSGFLYKQYAKDAKEQSND